MEIRKFLIVGDSIYIHIYYFQIYDNANIGGIPIMEIGIVFNKSQNLWRLGSL